MPVVKYLRHEITVDPGTSSRGEVAFVAVDGARRCFLGGEKEARRFLRERAWGPWYGPRAATWEIRLLDSRGSTVCYSSSRALEEARYFRAEGRPIRVSRTELCRHPGCDGCGEVGEPGRRGFGRSRPCPGHEPPLEVVELEWAPERGAPDTGGA